ncbi:hypothetical protein PVAND_014775 [Polypedilum vanderplanki]|uniref:Bulb-type lectin domain-containing protein n=1 Tax=Polypedilum vanderplanki TaxID=319348 RepID=A0A9J6BAQ0_POLVA|nr:hypothetical protein PVAND_014775 [Polypedilum vanderplanki]
MLKEIFVTTVLISIFNQANCITNQTNTIKIHANKKDFIDGDKLVIDQCLVEDSSIKSANGEFFLIMEKNGNLVIYATNQKVPIWATNTDKTGGKRVCMQADSDFNMYSHSNTLIWSSKTKGLNGTYVKLQNNGKLEMFTKADKKVWETKK